MCYDAASTLGSRFRVGSNSCVHCTRLAPSVCRRTIGTVVITQWNFGVEFQGVEKWISYFVVPGWYKSQMVQSIFLSLLYENTRARMRAHYALSLYNIKEESNPLLSSLKTLFQLMSPTFPLPILRYFLAATVTET